MTTQREVDAYLEWLTRVRRASAGTLESYSGTLSALVKARIDSSLPSLEAFVLRPRRGGLPPSPATMSREVTTLKSFFRWMQQRGLAPDPTVDLVAPTIHNMNPKPVSDEAWLMHWLRPELTDRERLLLGLPFFAGLRRAELSALHPSHVQLEPLSLVGFTRKGGGDDHVHLADVLEVWNIRMPHLRPDLFEAALRAGVARAHPEMPLLRGQINNAYRGLVRWTPHQGRHSFVTNLLRAGLPLHIVSRLANHASTNTTMRYCRVSGTDVRDWLVTAETRSS